MTFFSIRSQIIPMSENLSIRLATEKDDAFLGELLIQSFVETYAKKMPEVVVSEKRKLDLRNLKSKRDTAKVFVAQSGGQVVGTVTLFPSSHPETESWKSKSCDLRYMAVDPTFQGKGVADQLIEACKTQVKEWQLEFICLHVRRGAGGIARFYEKHGFIREGVGDLDQLPEIYLEGYFWSVKD